MAMIRLISPAQPVCDFSVSGAVVIVAGFTVDCEAYYAAGERTIEIRKNAQGATVVGGDGPYLATISVPVRKYTEGDNGQELVQLDPNAVKIALWPSV